MPIDLYILKRIFTDGGILTVIIGIVLTGMLLFQPRLSLADYPPDVQAAVPARTRREYRLGLIISIPLLAAMVAIPLYSTWLIKVTSGQISYWVALMTIAGEWLMVSMFDLLVLDIWLFYTWTPDFLVLPGTAGMAGYKDWRPHAKAQLLQGNALLLLLAALLAFLPTYAF